MMHIFSFRTFNLNKILFTAEELGATYELVLLDGTKGEHKTPEHLARHPLGKVPAISHEGRHLFESHSICRYFARLNNHRLYAKDPWQQGQIDQWCDFMGQHAGRWLATVFFQEYIKPNFFNREPDTGTIEEAKGFLSQQLPAMDKALSQGDFLAGKDISIADTIALAMVNTTEKTSVDLDPYPNLIAWYKHMQARPSYAKAIANYADGKALP